MWEERVKLAAEHGRNLGLPCPRRLVARELPRPWSSISMSGPPVYRTSAVGGGAGFREIPDSLIPPGVSSLIDFAVDHPEAWAAVYDQVWDGALRSIPLVPPWYMPARTQPILHPLLQSLADEFTRHVDAALRWFWMGDAAPEVPVFPAEIVSGLSDDRVRQIMEACQREVDRETNRVHQHPAYPGRLARYDLRLSDLPFELQRRLAEARRFVFLRYGITPEVFQRGYWSYWEIPCYAYDTCDKGE
jgi:hypothetical protein